jgi:hypothetical protein
MKRLIIATILVITIIGIAQTVKAENAPAPPKKIYSMVPKKTTPWLSTDRFGKLYLSPIYYQVQENLKPDYGLMISSSYWLNNIAAIKFEYQRPYTKATNIGRISLGFAL